MCRDFRVAYENGGLRSVCIPWLGTSGKECQSDLPTFFGGFRKLHNTGFNSKFLVVSGDDSTDISQASSPAPARRSPRFLPLIPLPTARPQQLASIPEVPAGPIQAMVLSTAALVQAIIPDVSLTSFPSMADDQSMMNESEMMALVGGDSNMSVDVTGDALDPTQL